MNPSLGERFSIRKAPDEDRNFFDAYCIIILAVHIVTANGNPKQKSRKFGTRRNIYKMPQVTCYRLPLYAIRSIRCNCSKHSQIATVHVEISYHSSIMSLPSFTRSSYPNSDLCHRQFYHTVTRASLPYFGNTHLAQSLLALCSQSAAEDGLLQSGEIAAVPRACAR